MKIKECRNCKSTEFTKLFSRENLSFTGEFTAKNKKIKKAPLNLIKCPDCHLVQLTHNYTLNCLYGPDYGYRTGLYK